MEIFLPFQKCGNCLARTMCVHSSGRWRLAVATKVGMLARRIGRGARGANDAGYGGREGERGLGGG